MSTTLIPDRLEQARVRLGITKAEASRKIGITKIGYNRYESGERAPSSQMIKVIAECMDTSFDFLTGITDNPECDVIVLRKKDDDTLFEFVIEYKRTDSDQKERMLNYIRAFRG